MTTFEYSYPRERYKIVERNNRYLLLLRVIGTFGYAMFEPAGPAYADRIAAEKAAKEMGLK